MRGRECGACERCRVRNALQVLAVCEVHEGTDWPAHRVDVAGHVKCRHFVPSRAWSDEQRAALSRQARAMAEATGHSVQECVAEMARIAGAYAEVSHP